MNIAVTAKGGVGKTIVSGTLARAFAQAGHEVLAIDHDADSNLAISIGLPRDEEIPAVPADLVERVDPPEGDPSWELAKPTSEVIEEYGVHAPDGVTLLRSRTVEADDESFVMGHVAVTEILSEAAEGPPAEDTSREETREHVTIVDMPAGLEYFGVINHVDVMLVVVAPATTALETLRTMDLYARHELDVSDVRVVANDVRSDRDLAFVEAFCADHEFDLDVVAVVPHDEAIRRAEFEGVAPIDYDESSTGVSAIRSLAGDLVEPPEAPGDSDTTAGR